MAMPTPASNTTPGSASNQPRKEAGKAKKATKAGKVVKTKTALTCKQKLDKHKRNEHVRRNKIGSEQDQAMTWIPKEYRVKGKKWDCKTQRVLAAADWLRDMKAGNDEYEKELNALLEAHGVINEAYLTAQTQVHEEQQQQQQQTQQQQQHGPQQPTPEWDLLQYSPPAFDAAPLLNPDLHWEHPSQLPILQPLQQATPSPPQPPLQPFQRYGVPMSEDELVAERMFNQGLQTFYQQHQPYPQQPPPSGWGMSQLPHTVGTIV